MFDTIKPVHRPLPVFLLFSFVLWTTRFSHFGPVPDASWAVFFLGGLLLASSWRWAFPALMLQAVAIDWIATAGLGVSSYCLSAAYAFLVPAYLMLWSGGALFAWRRQGNGFDLLRLGVTLFAGVTLCFVISDASFYWLSGRVELTSMAGYLENAWRWYPGFLYNTTAYTVTALALMVAGTRLWQGLPHSRRA